MTDLDGGPEVQEPAGQPVNGAATPPSAGDDDLDLDLDAGSEGGEDGSVGDDGAPEDPDLAFEEIRYKGVVAKVPAGWLKDQNRHFTQTQQQLAEEKRRIAEERDAERKTEADDLEDRGTLSHLRKVLKSYEELSAADRAQLRRDDFERWSELADNEAQLRRDIEATEKRLKERNEARTQRQQSQDRAAYEQFVKGVRDLIPRWDESKAKQVTDYGVKQGFSFEQLKSIRDPKMVGVLHKAMLYELAVAKKQRAQAAEEEPRPQTAPVRGRNARATSLPSDNDSIDEWTRKERARMEKKFGSRAH